MTTCLSWTIDNSTFTSTSTWLPITLKYAYQIWRVYSFIRAKDMTGAPNWSRDSDHTPFTDDFIIRWLGLAMINLCTKFEFSIYTRYEDMKDGLNVENRVVCLGSQGHHSSAMSPFYRVCMISYSTLVKTICLSYTAYDIASYMSKFAYFTCPTCTWRPRSNFKTIFGSTRKIQACAIDRVAMFAWSAILIQYRLVTYGQTDKRTDGHMAIVYTALA